MSEQEIRGALRQLCAVLDERASSLTTGTVCRTVGPLVIGAGLTVAACGSDVETDGDGTGGSGAEGTGGGATGGGGQSSTSGTAGSGGDGGDVGGGGQGGVGGGGMGPGGGFLYMAPDA